MLTEEIISKERGYLDKVALVVLEAYVSNQKPKGFEDSMSLSRVAYMFKYLLSNKVVLTEPNLLTYFSGIKRCYG